MSSDLVRLRKASPSPPAPLPEGEGRNVPSPTGGGRRVQRAGDGTRVKLPLPPDILAFARSLRGQHTDAEQVMWRVLRNRRFLDLKFRRQHSFPPYILDFYCDDLKLAVELDGGQHNTDTGLSRDEGRSIYLRSRGVQVVRYWNHDVLGKLETVLEDLMLQIQSRRAPSPPAPLPEGEGRNMPSPSGRGRRAQRAGEGTPPEVTS
jgi:very-short-patch-repair endonuclease